MSNENGTMVERFDTLPLGTLVEYTENPGWRYIKVSHTGKREGQWLFLDRFGAIKNSGDFRRSTLRGDYELQWTNAHYGMDYRILAMGVAPDTIL